MIVRGSETVLVQGITGKQGTFWSERMRDYGTKIVGGVNPKRAGEAHLELPVWATARDAARETNVDATVICDRPTIAPRDWACSSTHARRASPRHASLRARCSCRSSRARLSWVTHPPDELPREW